MFGVKSFSSFDDFDEEICAAFLHLEQKDLRSHPLEFDDTQPRGVFKPLPIRYTEPVIYGEGGPKYRIQSTENILTKDMCEGYDPEIIPAFGHIEEKALHPLPVDMDCSPPRGLLNPLPLRYSSTTLSDTSGENSPSSHFFETTSINSDDFEEIPLGDSVEDEYQEPTSKPRSLLKRFLNLLRRIRL